MMIHLDMDTRNLGNQHMPGVPLIYNDSELHITGLKNVTSVKENLSHTWFYKQALEKCTVKLYLTNVGRLKKEKKADDDDDDDQLIDPPHA